ncbi:hypothetical protein BHM03_00055487 [Ensete ventricosum]|nr:hypothetical protein BHM03_00055487 [Ensete ventricosum]
MFLLPVRGEEIARKQRIACAKKSPMGDGSRGRFFTRRRRIERTKSNAVSRFFFSLFFFLPLSVDTDQNRPPTIEIDRRRSKSTVTDRFRVVTGRKQPQSTAAPGSGRSTYR